MKLEVGMYVRFKKGKTTYIRKLLEIIHDFETFNVYRIDKEYFDYEEKEYFDIVYPDEIIGKPSHNPIDLIEVGDILIVNGIKYTVLQDKEHCMNALHIKTIDNYYSTIKYLFEQNMVESILTKEQFEREAYKI